MFLKAVRILGITCLLLSVAAAQEQKSQWKDRAEFDMFLDMAKEPDPNKKLEKIKAWQAKYPESNFKKEGLTFTVNAYAQLGKFPELISTAQQILAIDPLDVTSLYWITSMTPKLNNTSPDALDTGEKAASKLVDDADKVFAADRKPPGSTDDQWKKARADMEVLGLKTLGWVAMSRKDNEKAEGMFKRALEKNPNDGEIAYWMYTVIRAMKKAERSSDALFYLARAATLPQDKGGLPNANRKQVDDFFVKAYASYHGQDDAGLKELRQLAMEKAIPPSGFVIKTAAQIAFDKEEQFKKSNPQLAYWMHLKKELTGDNGEQFFDSMKDALLPGKIPDTEYEKLKGKIVSMKPAVNPKELVLLLDTDQSAAGSAGEVTLRLDAPLKGRAEPETEVQFKGVAKAFTKDPFMLTFEVQKDDVDGWPALAAPTPAKKATGARKAPVHRKK
ncbi:MAG: hypothetical protein LC126_00415 [Bryobacterales bacterium]|nr:hypothetical protein [Bryobacterales bacterium]